MERIDNLARCRVKGDRVHGEVTPLKVFGKGASKVDIFRTAVVRVSAVDPERRYLELIVFKQDSNGTVLYSCGDCTPEETLDLFGGCGRGKIEVGYGKPRRASRTAPPTT